MFKLKAPANAIGGVGFFSTQAFLPVSVAWDAIGARIWREVQFRLEKMKFFENADPFPNQLQIGGGLNDSPKYRESILSRVRLGQGAFRIMITEAYKGRCAITGEHTLPVLEAAHIKPYSSDGPHTISNGLLLRSDLHKLFDAGYVTVTPEYRLEVSSRLKEEFNNGKIYYQMNGHKLRVMPGSERDMPNKDFLSWHNENIYRVG